MPDRIDARDWFYRPSLVWLPNTLVNCDGVPRILDQGTEGACTGFALAAVVNFLIQRREDGPVPEGRLVSPRMLYELARAYDEWPGEEYEGSSARGAMKAWVRHGVCPNALWPIEKSGREHLTPAVAKAAREAPGGAFYRVAHREIRDMHAALAETGILYATLMVHDGWDAPGRNTVEVAYRAAGRARTRKFARIERRGRAASGHAVAICGYTKEGFIIQNSWGESWGSGGFALLPYEDFLLHATDVWAAQLGVPLAMDLWTEQGAADTTKGMARARDGIQLNDIRDFVVNVGNDGKLSRSGDYWTTDQDVKRLFSAVIPKKAETWPKRRVLLYLHGGLNSEADVAKRVIAFKDVMTDNEIYPLHIMWESGAKESLHHIIQDVFTGAAERAGNFMRTVREYADEARDWSLELTAAGIGGALWREMKENAALASARADGKGAMTILNAAVLEELAQTSPAERARWELHVVAHSAGAIYVAPALPLLLNCGIPLKSLQFMAPAMTVDLFKDSVLPLVEAGHVPQPRTYILSDEAERDDTVGGDRLYRKSLLYLVSNAFERKRGTPLLGMECYAVGLDATADRPARPEADTQVKEVIEKDLVIAQRTQGDTGAVSTATAHGGFDNDPPTMNAVLRHILGAPPQRPFTPRDMLY